MRFLIILGLVLNTIFSFSTTINIDSSQLQDKISVFHLNYIDTQEDSLDIYSYSSLSNWKELNNGKDLHVSHQYYDKWIRFNVKSTLNHSLDLVLELESPTLIYYEYCYVGNDTIFGKGGNDISSKEKDIVYRKQANNLHLDPLEEKTIYYRFNNNGYRIDVPINIWTANKFAENVSSVSSLLYYGGMMVIMTFLFILLIRAKSRKVFYFLSYVFSLFVFNSTMEGYAFLLTEMPLLWINRLVSLSILFTIIFNYKFFQHFIGTQKLFPKFNQLVNINVAALLIIAPFTLIESANVFILKEIALVVIMPLILISFGTFISIKKNYHDGIHYLIGYSFMVVGAIMVILSTHDFINSGFWEMNALKITSTIEVIVLSIGIIKSFQREDKNKQKQIIEQLKKINKLTVESKEAIEKQAEQDKKLAASEMNTLRSQMNPHFMFNTLNSIQNYIISNDAKAASRYLAKFAKLMRKILDQSRNENITLREEIDILNLYLQLETIRFEDQFDYHIHVDEAIDLDGTEIPSMIIQPYVENAILHGLRNKLDEQGHIEITFQETETALKISIDDNGVGRKKAMELKTKAGKLQRKSYAMSITKERIDILKETAEVAIDLDIIDKENEKHEAEGTLITLTIPFKT